MVKVIVLESRMGVPGVEGDRELLFIDMQFQLYKMKNTWTSVYNNGNMLSTTVHFKVIARVSFRCVFTTIKRNFDVI